MAQEFLIYKVCGFCGCSGEENSSEGVIACTVCGGSGMWLFGKADKITSNNYNINKQCGYCGGSGEVPIGGETPSTDVCPQCGGSGIRIWAKMEKP